MKRTDDPDKETSGRSVARLHEALQGRGLATAGLRAELVGRLERAIRGTVGGAINTS